MGWGDWGLGFNCVGVIRDRAVNLLLQIRSPPASVPDRQGVKENVRGRSKGRLVSPSTDLSHPCALDPNRWQQTIGI